MVWQIGFCLFTQTSEQWLSFIQTFAGGAILMMLSNSMIPEPYEPGCRYAGVFTVLGFFLAVAMVSWKTPDTVLLF